MAKSFSLTRPGRSRDDLKRSNQASLDSEHSKQFAGVCPKTLSQLGGNWLGGGGEKSESQNLNRPRLIFMLSIPAVLARPKCFK